jgi:uncharacterized protein involved in exopolysaccharide biosynthesis
MTKYIEVSAYPGKSITNQGRWQNYLLLGIATNLALWVSALLYLKLTPPTYTSYSAMSLPGEGSNASLSIPNIGQAYYESSSPYAASASMDPRENYKFIAESENVLKAAASQLNMSLEEFGRPRFKVIPNTTVMSVEFSGATPEEAQKKSLAFYKAFETRLNQLRSQEVIQREISSQAALTSSQKKLEIAQKRLSEYKARSGLNSEAQISDLTANIEQLRRQRAEILAQQQQANARLKQLSANLKVSSQQATDAFGLQTDPVFQQNLKNYSEASANLVVLESKFLPDHPSVIAEKAKRDAAAKAMVARATSIIGRPVDLEALKQLSLNTTNTNNGVARENLFQQIVTVQSEQKGLAAQAQTIDRQISALENRLKKLAQQESYLDALKRDLQVAEALFSSTLTKLDLGKSNAFGSYPLIQIVTEPTLPEHPSQPKKIYAFLGAAFGSLFATSGIVLLWLRDRKSQRRYLSEG